MKLNSVFRILLILLAVIAVWNYKLIGYGISQLTGQLHIIRNAVPVSEVLSNPATPDSVKEKLIYINQVRRFAMDSLGLKNSDNYTTLFDQKGEPVIWVVTASLPYELKAHEWWFPVIGTVSYKGFFTEEKAIREAEKVESEGYETDIYSPSAWSTLGYFTDPILSNMLNRGPGRLADLIIHELTHATVYLKSSVDFNENFATFVGEKGAEMFLKHHFGNESPEHTRFIQFLEDDEIYHQYMIESARHLDSLYRSFSSETSITQKETQKREILNEITEGIRHLPYHQPERFHKMLDKKVQLNNTDFLSYLRYRKDQSVFREALEKNYNGDLRAMVKDVVEKSEQGESELFATTGLHSGSE